MLKLIDTCECLCFFGERGFDFWEYPWLRFHFLIRSSAPSFRGLRKYLQTDPIQDGNHERISRQSDTLSSVNDVIITQMYYQHVIVTKLSYRRDFLRSWSWRRCQHRTVRAALALAAATYKHTESLAAHHYSDLTLPLGATNQRWHVCSTSTSANQG